MKIHADEVRGHERFEFGRNWQAFIPLIDRNRIDQAEQSLRSFLGDQDLDGKRFLDIGSGSGIISLAARRAGMRVVSFDYDPASVACTEKLRRHYFEADLDWQVLEGSILDETFVSALGQFEIVYAWGILHHTGAMWRALETTGHLVAAGGWLIIAIYNDQGPWSRFWRRIKRTYNRLPRWLRLPFALVIMVPREMKIAFVPIVKFRPMSYLSQWSRSASDGKRGMSRWIDMIDWVGGYPFEVAKPEEIFEFFKQRGFVLEKLTTSAGELGCNEFAFRRIEPCDGRMSNR